MGISTKECFSHFDDVRLSVENLLNVIESKANLIGAETFVEKVDGKFKITIQCDINGLEKFMYRVSSPTPFDKIPS